MAKIRLTVRHGLKRDINNVVSLHLITIRLMRSLCPPGFGQAMQAPVKRKDVLSYFNEALEGDESVLLVCEVNGEFAGFALGSIESFKDDLIDAPFLTVEFIETEPRFRRQGVARSLLAKMERLARKRGMKAIELAVWANNAAAMRLYEQLGFKTLEVRAAKPLQ